MNLAELFYLVVYWTLGLFGTVFMLAFTVLLVIASAWYIGNRLGLLKPVTARIRRIIDWLPWGKKRVEPEKIPAEWAAAFPPEPASAENPPPTEEGSPPSSGEVETAAEEETRGGEQQIPFGCLEEGVASSEESTAEADGDEPPSAPREPSAVPLERLLEPLVKKGLVDTKLDVELTLPAGTKLKLFRKEWEAKGTVKLSTPVTQQPNEPPHHPSEARKAKKEEETGPFM